MGPPINPCHHTQRPSLTCPSPKIPLPATTEGRTNLSTHDDSGGPAPVRALVRRRGIIEVGVRRIPHMLTAQSPPPAQPSFPSVHAFIMLEGTMNLTGETQPLVEQLMMIKRMQVSVHTPHRSSPGDSPPHELHHTADHQTTAPDTPPRHGTTPHRTTTQIYHITPRQRRHSTTPQQKINL